MRVPMQLGASVQLNTVERWINQRTGGRLQGLTVERTGDSVIVHGHAGSYYHKQLALAAAMETVDPDLLVLDIDVIPRRSRIH